MMEAIHVLGVDNILFGVGDFDGVRAFYEGKLGLPVTFAVEAMGIVGYRLGSDEAGLFLRVQSSIVPTSARETPRLWLEVADAREAATELTAKGIAPLREPFEINTGWVVEFADPWGNVIGLTDYVKDSAKTRPASQ
jgi:predicted enzyme related to lactoylglutathione lyase